VIVGVTVTVGVGDSDGVDVVVGSGVSVIVGVSDGSRVTVGVTVGVVNPGNAHPASRLVAAVKYMTNTIVRCLDLIFIIISVPHPIRMLDILA
jgi:hypothetical protein